MKRKIFALLTCVLVLCMAVSPAFATEPVATVGAEIFDPVVDAITNQITPSSVVAIVAAVIGASIGLVFMWWAVRKVSRSVMGAFRKGKLSV